MADPNYDTRAAAKMDYAEHERTYNLFLGMTKWGTIGVVVLLLAMLVGLIAGGGWTGGIFTLVVLSALAWFFA